VTFFHDPTNEHNYTQLSLPQRWRMIYPAMLEMVANGLGAFKMHQDEDMYHRVVNSLADMFSSHISHSTAKSMREGASDFADIFQVPPPVQVGAGMLGVSLRPSVGKFVENKLQGDQGIEGMVVPTNTPGRLPGQMSSSTFISNNDGNWVHAFLANTFGLMGDSLYKSYSSGVDRFKVNNSIADVTNGMVADAGQSWRDQAPFGNMVWGNNVKQATRNPMEDYNDTTMFHMKNTASVRDEAAQGLTRVGGVPVLSRGMQGKMSDDPMIKSMAATISTNYKNISGTLGKQVTDLKAQIKGIEDSPYYSPQDKRRLGNDYTAKLNQVQSQVNARLMQLNAQLSYMAGGRHVDAGTFKAERGMEQFHD
jgi:hypothetical protein